MKKDRFFELARKNISANPIDRAPAKMVELLKDGQNLTIKDVMFDVHAHCFTYDNVPKDFLSRGFHPPRFVLRLMDWGITAWSKIHYAFTKKELKYWERFGKQRIVETMAKGKSAYGVMDHHFNKYVRAFRNMQEKGTWKHEIPGMIHAELMMDMERGISGGVQENFYSQLNDLANLRSRLIDWEKSVIEKRYTPYHRYILPFLGIDPRNENLYEDFLAVFSEVGKRNEFTNDNIPKDVFPFFGVKVYPCLGYLPSDPKLMDIFKVCEEKNIPVTTHCGSGTTRDSRDVISGKYYASDGFGNINLLEFNQDFSKVKKKKKAHAYARFFNAPSNWIPVAEKYPKLKINLAHFGSNKEWENYRSGGTNTHIEETLDMIIRFENVYADISYACATRRNLHKIVDLLRSAKIEKLKRITYRKKILYGSDFFLNQTKKNIITVIESTFEVFDEETINDFYVRNPYRFLMEVVG